MVDPVVIMDAASKVWTFLNSTEVQTVIKQIKEKVQKLKILTYDTLMSYVVKEKPDDERVVAAALLKETKGSQVCISVIYLNSKNVPVFGDGRGKDYGFTLQPENIDDEIKDLFGDKNLVLLT